MIVQEPWTEVGPSDRSSLNERVQVAIDCNRAQSEKRFREVLDSPSTAPALRFSCKSPEQIEQAIKTAEQFTIIVSFHTRAYFLFLLLLNTMEFKSTAITTLGIADKFEQKRLLAPGNLEFVTTLSHGELKRCKREKKALFIMADVLIGYGTNAPLPILGRALRYTMSWAELATGLGLNVVVALIKDHGDYADVSLQHLGVRTGSPYELACEVCGVFEAYMGEDIALWENLPALEAFGYTLPDCRSGTGPELMKMLAKLAMCDRYVAAALREGVNELRS